MIPMEFTQRQQWVLDHPYLCVLPYSVHHMQIEFDGQRDVAKQKTTLRNSCCCNLVFDSELDNWKSGLDPANDVKKTVAQGHLNPRCRRCYDSEKQTGTSERTMALMSMPPEQMISFAKTLESQEFNIRIKFSNLCNLACRSCSPSFSSRYAQVHGLQVPKSLSEDIGDDTERWNYITNSFELYLKKYKFINLTLLGGESLIQPGAIKLLEWLDDQALLERINLSITSNFTNFNTKIISWLPKFNKIHFSASIDSVHENFEYVRWPASFQTVISNFLQLDYMPIESLDITLQPLINLNNLFYINDILDFWLEISKVTQHRIKIDPVTMYRPHHMTVQNLPWEYRQAAQDILDTAIDHSIWQTQNHGLLDYIKGLRQFVSSREQIYDQFELYLFDTVKHDRANNTSMAVGNKKFYDLLNQKHKLQYDRYYRDNDVNLLPIDQKKIYWNLPL